MLSTTQLRKDGEAFWSEVERCDMLDIQGLPNETTLETIYNKYAYLADMKTAQELKRKYDAAEGLEKKKLGWLVIFITERIGGRRTATLVDDYRGIVGSSRLNIAATGENIAFRSGTGRMQSERNRDIRQQVQDETNRVIKIIAPYREKVFKEETKVIQEVGFQNYFDMYNQCKEVDLKGVVKMLEPFVEHTEELYCSCMDNYLKEHLGVSLKNAQRHDVLYFISGHTYESGFPEDKVVPVVEKFLSGMGLDLYLGGRAKIDIERRPNKSARSFTCPVVIPDDITLVCTPQNGPEGYANFLHEASHTMHRGNTSKDQIFELKYFGDKTVTEGYSTFFEHLAMNPLWLEDFLGLTDTKAVNRYQALRELHQIRRYGSKVRFEVELHSTPGFEEKKHLYTKYLKETTKIDYPPDNYVLDQDQGFYSASYARAWVFAVMLEYYFTEKYGPRWWQSKKAGEDLLRLYSLGQSKNGDELAHDLGFERMDSSYIEEKLLKILK